jgi:hypothetical protein
MIGSTWHLTGRFTTAAITCFPFGGAQGLWIISLQWKSIPPLWHAARILRDKPFLGMARSPISLSFIEVVVSFRRPSSQFRVILMSQI